MVGDYSPTEKTLADRLVEENYADLVNIARMRRRRGRLNDTMGTIDLLHESILRINRDKTWESRQHFLNAVALAMRHVIVDYARKKQAAKRGSGAKKLQLDDAQHLMPEFLETPEQIVGISRLLDKLKAENPRWMRIVDARYFSGLTELDTAHLLGISARSVRRDWAHVKDWMADNLDLE